MAKPNYSFQKRQREIAKSKKKEEKRLQKLAKKNAEAGEGGDSPGADIDDVGNGVVDTDTADGTDSEEGTGI